MIALSAVSVICFSQQVLGAKEVFRRLQEVEQKRNLAGYHILDSNLPVEPSRPLSVNNWVKQSLKSNFDWRDDTDSTMNQLPPPEYWPEIDATYRTQNAPTQFKILGAFLVRDRARLRSLVLQVGAADPELEEVWQLMLELGQCWSDKELVATAFVKQMELMKVAEDKGLPLYTGAISTPYIRSSRTPALVRIVGRAKAKELYRLYFRTLQMPIEIMSRDDYEVIVDLFRKEGASFPFAHFEVIQTIGASDLYDAMSKRFPGEDEPNKSYAFSYYALANVFRGNGDRFLAHAKDIAGIRFFSIFAETILRSFDIEEELSDSYNNPKKAQNAFEFFEKALSADHTVRFWQELCEAGLAAGRRDRLITILTEATEKEKAVSPLDFERRPPELLRSIASSTETSAQIADRMLSHMRIGHGDASEAAKMGQLLNRRDLIDFGMKNLLRGIIGEGNDLMFQTQRYAEIENEYINGSFPDPSSLVHVYSALGRHQDVIDVLNLSSHWRSNDLKNEQDLYGGDFNLLLAAAKAFLATGDQKNGMNVLRWSLRSRKKVDEGYRLLIDILGEATALSELERMEQLDPFDNRPPLWRATILLKQGKLDEAERAAKKSIEIDAADEDIEPGRRMAATEVLIEVLEAKKKSEEVAKLRKTVEAIRLSEKADIYADAGLGFESIRLYREALGIDPQSCRTHLRLANAYFKGGLNAEAGSEYRLGFELLPRFVSRKCSIPLIPDSYRWNPVSTRIGEDVFGAMVRRRPGDPRSLYLLGLVRYGQNRKEESQELMRRAVVVDPKFLRAHQAMLSSMTSVDGVSPEVKQASMMALYDLDSVSRVTLNGYGSRILDAAAMYRRIEGRRGRIDPPLYIFPAVKNKNRDTQMAPTGQFLFHSSPMNEIASYIDAAGRKG